ncbi:hypothetical protein N7488_000446 [Penicillium malachiteum]|nr:hypothetical protein N7488_000446 [Penicillium malachiteum]
MTPRITNWADLAFSFEKVDPDTNKVQSTSFGLIDDHEIFYHGQISSSKIEISFYELMHALHPIADDSIFPTWPVSGAENLKAKSGPLSSNLHIKRPALQLYVRFRELGVEKQLYNSLVAEAKILEELSQHPHPNLIGYHGCRVARGHITGIVLDRHPYDLRSYIENGHDLVNKTLFMTGLESVIRHLHALGWAHNDLTPANVLVGEDYQPLLIDFEGCQKFGEGLTYIRGTEDWIEGKIEDYTTSEARHDIFALGKIRDWLDTTPHV